MKFIPNNNQILDASQLSIDNYIIDDRIVFAYQPAIDQYRDLISKRQLELTDISFTSNYKFYQAASFNGISSKIDTGNWGNDIWCEENAKFTIVVDDLDTSVFTGWRNIIGKYINDNNSSTWSIVGSSDGQIQVGLLYAGTYKTWYPGWPPHSGGYNTGPCQAVFVIDLSKSGSDACVCYKDGKEISAFYNATGEFNRLNENSAHITIGDLQNASWDYPLYGTLPRILIYKGALTADEVYNLYTNPFSIYKNTNNIHSFYNDIQTTSSNDDQTTSSDIITISTSSDIITTSSSDDINPHPLEGWTKRALIEIDGRVQSDGPSYNFPYLLKLRLDLMENIRSDKGDIRFSTDIYGKNLLPFDYLYDLEWKNIPKWTNTSELEDYVCAYFRVKIPFVSSTKKTKLYVWWGNPSATMPDPNSSIGRNNAYPSDCIAYYVGNELKNRITNTDITTSTNTSLSTYEGSQEPWPIISLNQGRFETDISAPDLANGYTITGIYNISTSVNGHNIIIGAFHNSSNSLRSFFVRVRGVGEASNPNRLMLRHYTSNGEFVDSIPTGSILTISSSSARFFASGYNKEDKKQFSQNILNIDTVDADDFFTPDVKVWVGSGSSTQASADLFRGAVSHLLIYNTYKSQSWRELEYYSLFYPRYGITNWQNPTRFVNSRDVDVTSENINDWQDVCEIDVLASQLNEGSVEDFSLLVKVHKNSITSLKSDLSDVRFTSDINGLNQLASDYLYEANNYYYFRVLMPFIDTTLDYKIYLWHNNPSALSLSPTNIYGRYNAYDHFWDHYYTGADIYNRITGGVLEGFTNVVYNDLTLNDKPAFKFDNGFMHTEENINNYYADVTSILGDSVISPRFTIICLAQIVPKSGQPVIKTLIHTDTSDSNNNISLSRLIVGVVSTIPNNSGRFIYAGYNLNNPTAGPAVTTDVGWWIGRQDTTRDKYVEIQGYKATLSANIPLSYIYPVECPTYFGRRRNQPNNVALTLTGYMQNIQGHFTNRNNTWLELEKYQHLYTDDLIIPCPFTSSSISESISTSISESISESLSESLSISESISESLSISSSEDIITTSSDILTTSSESLSSSDDIITTSSEDYQTSSSDIIISSSDIIDELYLYECIISKLLNDNDLVQLVGNNIRPFRFNSLDDRDGIYINRSITSLHNLSTMQYNIYDFNFTIVSKSYDKAISIADKLISHYRFNRVNDDNCAESTVVNRIYQPINTNNKTQYPILHSVNVVVRFIYN